VCGEYSPARRFHNIRHTVHPHVCGEYVSAYYGFADYLRFIPTCVGNTSLATTARHVVVGSSPRVWGIPSSPCWLWWFCRSTPRVWGILSLSLCALSGVTVHPHVCGEYVRIHTLLQRDRHGSSPRVWGILARRQPIVRALLRFIPTCVGNTPTAIALSISNSVHPHVCGEYDCKIIIDTHPSRFIPTCVGNTMEGRLLHLPSHGSSPRVWGILFQHFLNFLNFHGSSPRVWGIRHYVTLSASGHLRFIPTCVGNTNLEATSKA